MHKTRPAHEQVGIVEVTGRVRDKIAVVGDDVTTTGGTQIAGAKVLREHGAKDVWMFVTHSLLDAETLSRVASSGITGLVITDTVPVDPTRKPENVTVLTVSRLLAETIMNVFCRRLRLGDLRRREPALLGGWSRPTSGATATPDAGGMRRSAG